MKRLIDITLAATRQMGTPHRNWTATARAGESIEEQGLNQAIVMATRVLADLKAVEREEQQETGT